MKHISNSLSALAATLVAVALLPAIAAAAAPTSPDDRATHGVGSVPSSVAPAAGGLPGTYTTTIKTPSEVNGKWVVTFFEGATYSVSLNRQAISRGRYSAGATTITLHESDFGCGGSGSYAWKLSGRTLTFIKKRESRSCRARAAVLAHPFTKVALAKPGR